MYYLGIFQSEILHYEYCPHKMFSPGRNTYYYVINTSCLCSIPCWGDKALKWLLNWPETEPGFESRSSDIKHLSLYNNCLPLWPPHAKSWLIGKDPDVGRDLGQEEKGTTQDEMAGWHHRLDGHGFEWTPGVGDRQGGLTCCDSWGRKESDTTEQLNWTEWGSGLLMRLKRLYHPPCNWLLRPH